MQHNNVTGLKGLFRVFTYLPGQVDTKLQVWGLQVLLYVALTEGPCLCKDISHDGLLQLTKSFQRTAKVGLRMDYDLLVLGRVHGRGL